MNKTYTDKEVQNQKLKENKERYLELVQNFLNKVVSSNNFYLKGKGLKWNWKLDDIKVKQDTWIQGKNNRKIFDLWNDSIVSITTPKFEFDWSEEQIPNPYAIKGKWIS